MPVRVARVTCAHYARTCLRALTARVCLRVASNSSRPFVTLPVVLWRAVCIVLAPRFAPVLATVTTGCAALACAVIVAALASCICLFCGSSVSFACLLSLLPSMRVAPDCCYRCACCLPALACYHCQLCQLLTSLLLTQSLRYTVHVHSLSGYRLPVRSAPCSPCRAPASRWLRCYAVYHIRCFHLLIDS